MYTLEADGSESAPRFSWLGAVPCSAALLDARGRIIAVNASWWSFCRDNDGDPGGYLGWNYLDVCLRSGDAEAEALGRRLEEVVAGEVSLLGWEYPCHSPTEQRWFLFTATPFVHAGRSYVITAHENVTDRYLLKAAVRERDRRLDFVLAHAREGLAAVRRSDGTILYTNARANALLGRSPESLVGRMLSLPLAAGERRMNLHPTADDARTILLNAVAAEWEGEAAWLLYLHDVTERERAERALHEQEALLERTSRAAQVGGWEADLRTGELSWTAVTRDLLEVDPGSPAPPLEEALPRFWRGESYEWVKRNLDQAVSGHVHADFEARLTTARGRFKWARVYAVPEIVRGECVRLVGTFQDITRRKELESRLARWGSAFAAAAEGVLITDAQDRILAVNPAFTDVTGYAEDEVLGDTPALLRPEDIVKSESGWGREAAGTGSWTGEAWIRRKDGELLPARKSINAIADETGTVTHYVTVIGDLSQLKAAESQLEHLAYHDPLTGLANRRLFQDHLEQALAQGSRSGERVAVMLLDLDDFKAINDGFGHETGDRVLQVLGARLQSMLREGDTVARWGGDEFALLAWDPSDGLDSSRLAERLLTTIEAPFTLGEHEFRVGGSLGIVLSDRPNATPGSLIMEADGAMYQAKVSGRRIAFYSEDVGRAARERLFLGTELSRALGRHELTVHYQPQLELRTGACVGLEALARWHHPTQGWIDPERFIPIAERSGLIVQLGDEILEQACRQAADWMRAGWEFGRLAVNIALPQLDAGDLPARVSDLLARTGLPASRLELELTESFLVEPYAEVLQGLQRLRAEGLSIAVDDFGTGYSSLQTLKTLPVDRLKIDRCFVAGLPEDASDIAIVQTILTLARTLGLSVVAEGIERPEQRAALMPEPGLGGQGFLFAKPMSASRVRRAVRGGAGV